MGILEGITLRLRERRNRILDGKLNCIPFPFPRFRAWFPGIEKGKYIIITANQKVGKSKLSDYLFVYEPLFYAMESDELKLKVLYFTLEVSPEAKRLEFLSHLLFRLDNIIISPTDLTSVDKDKPVSEEIIELLESDRYKPYIDKYEKIVEYIDFERNPTGINKYCRDYALEHGKLHYKKELRKDKLSGEMKEVSLIDRYEPDDPEEIKLILLDNASNLINENGMKKMETIDKMSKYAIILRNQLNYTFVLIQHQAQAQEGIENLKMGKLKPSSDGLADCKTTSRDANIVIGLYSPYKYGIKDYERYDITKFKNHIRFMEIIEDRDYGANGQICPLFFNGAVSTFNELPRPEETEEIKKYYTYLDIITKQRMNTLLLSFVSKIKHIFHNK